MSSSLLQMALANVTSSFCQESISLKVLSVLLSRLVWYGSRQIGTSDLKDEFQAFALISPSNTGPLELEYAACGLARDMRLGKDKIEDL
jgi:hypothetical protein